MVSVIIDMRARRLDRLRRRCELYASAIRLFALTIATPTAMRTHRQYVRDVLEEHRRVSELIRRLEVAKE